MISIGGIVGAVLSLTNMVGTVLSLTNIEGTVLSLTNIVGTVPYLLTHEKHRTGEEKKTLQQVVLTVVLSTASRTGSGAERIKVIQSNKQ